MDNLIWREDAIIELVFNEETKDIKCEDMRKVLNVLKKMPSAEPKHSIAEWQKDFREYINMLNIPRDDYNGIMEYINDLPSVEPEINKQELIRTMNAGIIATNTEDVYSCGMRNGIRWCRALLEDGPPKFEDASQYAELRKKGYWIKKEPTIKELHGCYYECSKCHKFSLPFQKLNFCPNCGADMRGE